MIKLENLPELKIEVDNRNLDSESLFVAIVGARFNPLEHLNTVVNSGCKYVVCEKKYESSVSKFNDRIKFILVDDVEKTIQEYGKIVADQFKARGGCIIAISGSNGKTTTKEMLYHILEGSFSGDVVCTQKNNNNHLGVPFSLFQIKSNTRYAIIELGSNHPGEIKNLCEISEPNIGVTTNIGATHLEFFETLEAVYREESTLGHYAKTFFKNNDDSFLAEFPAKDNFLSFGEKGHDFKFNFNGSGKISVNDIELKNLHITGKHNFINLGLAFALAATASPEQTEEHIQFAASFKPTANRSQWVEWRGVDVFLDAYNANPSSMRVAIEGFIEKLEGDSEKIILVLGDMNELGVDAARFHEQIGEFLRRYPKSKKVFIGSRASQYSAGLELDCFCFGDVQEAEEKLKELSQQVNHALIKGSRSLQLETILDI